VCLTRSRCGRRAQCGCRQCRATSLGRCAAIGGKSVRCAMHGLREDDRNNSKSGATESHPDPHPTYDLAKDAGLVPVAVQSWEDGVVIEEVRSVQTGSGGCPVWSDCMRGGGWIDRQECDESSVHRNNMRERTGAERERERAEEWEREMNRPTHHVRGFQGQNARASVPARGASGGQWVHGGWECRTIVVVSPGEPR
jgi:hypothetical protein